MIKNLFLLFLTVAFQFSVAQTVNMSHHFKPGNRYTFDYVKYNNTGDAVKDKIKGRTCFYLNIISENADGIHATWTIGPTTLEGAEAKTVEATKDLMNVNKNFELKILLDLEGSIVGIENFDQCVEHIQSLSELFAGQMPGTMTPEELQKLNVMLEPTYATAEALLENYFNELDTYFSVYGAEWTTGSYWVFQDETKNALIGCEIPYDTEVKVESIPNSKSEITIVSVFNEEKFKTALVDFDEKIKTEHPVWSQTLKEMNGVELIMTQKFKLNPRSRMVESLKTSKKVTVDGKVTEKLFEFNLVK